MLEKTLVASQGNVFTLGLSLVPLVKYHEMEYSVPSVVVALVFGFLFRCCKQTVSTAYPLLSVKPEPLEQ